MAKVVKKNVFFPDKVPEKLLKEVEEAFPAGSKVDPSKEVKTEIVPPEKIHVEYAGDPILEAGETVNEDDIIAVKKSFLRKEKTTSPVKGVIEEVNEIEFIIQPDAEEEDDLSYSVPFESKVKNMSQDGKLILEFPAVQINLFDAKGKSAIGKIRFIDSEVFRNKKKTLPDLKDAIVVADYIPADAYPRLSTLGAKGLIVNHMESLSYDGIIILAVPIGLITGFGDLKADSKITKYLKSKDGEKVWFDAEFKRLVIPDKKPPTWTKDYKLDLKKAGVL